MNITLLEDFREEINLIREYWQHIKYIDSIVDYAGLPTDNEQILALLNNIKDHYGSFGTDKKIFEYKASIISLYGLLEKYVEIWIKEYLSSLSGLVVEYSKIDENIKNNHFEFSLKLINTITNRESSKYQHLNKEQILTNLNNCIVNSKGYKFNTDAFVLLSGNLKHKQIVEIFRLININLNDALRKNDVLLEYFENELQIAHSANLHADNLYNIIIDLVERRNQIAHGSEAIDDILNISELESYIDFLDKYCQAIFETLAEELIKQESIHNFQKIEKVIQVIRGKILVFEIENYTIKAGDMLIIKTAEGKFYKKPILTIELNHVTQPLLTIVEKTEIAMSVEPRIKDNQTFYIAKQ